MSVPIFPLLGAAWILCLLSPSIATQGLTQTDNKKGIKMRAKVLSFSWMSSYEQKEREGKYQINKSLVI